MKIPHRLAWLAGISILVLTGCGGDVSPPWEKDSRAEKGKGKVASDPENAGDFPFGDLFPTGLLDMEGSQVSADRLGGKYVGIYFSAHWCPPCHDFTPKLVSFRDRNAGEFEVVFVSLCNSEGEKAEFMEEMKMSWLTIPGCRTEAGILLAQSFDDAAIPQLVILAPSGDVVTQKGRDDIEKNSKGALAAWKAQSLTESSEARRKSPAAR